MIHMLKGKTFMVGEREGRHFFAWSASDDDLFFEEKLPNKNFKNETSGIEWFDTHDGAYQAYLDAWKQLMTEGGNENEE